MIDAREKAVERLAAVRSEVVIDQRAIDARIASAVVDEPYDAGDEADRSHDPEAARALHSLMRSISERCYAAIWMRGLENALWDMLQDGPRRYGRYGNGEDGGCVSETSIAALRQLHVRCGGWWRWHDDLSGADPTKPDDWGTHFVTTAEWAAQVKR